MKKILSILGQTLCILALTLLIGISGSFLFFDKPSYAANKLTPEEKIDRAYEYNEAAGFQEEGRQEAYEQAIKDSKTPQTMEKAYERELKAEDVQEPNIIQQAEKVIEKATSK
jgi:hypothetical protein